MQIAKKVVSLSAKIYKLYSYGNNDIHSKQSQMIITLEDNALVADIKKALKMIRGIASVRVANISDDKSITPTMLRSINKARKEYKNGETISCSTPEDMQRYFDSL